MITTDLDKLTGFPFIKETRKSDPFRSLPRDIGKMATEMDAKPEGTLWYPVNHEWSGGVLQRVRCCKCGEDIKGWRMALDRLGKPVEVNGRPAVAFLPYPNIMSTPIVVFSNKLQKKMVFNAQHCHDCVIEDTEIVESFACCLGGADSSLSYAQGMMMSSVSPDSWATYLYRFSSIDPIGRAKEEDILMSERIPVPGELLTSAQYAMDIDHLRRNQIPSDVIVEFQGDEIPMGWMEVPGKKGKIKKI